jgi:cytochrome c oxidase assembly factor CtaG
LGLLGTWLGLKGLSRRQSPPGPTLAWTLGLAALLPAWLLSFVGLLGPSTGERPEPSLAMAFILSSSAGLLGVILSDAAVRRLGNSEREHRSDTYWLLGVVALLPAWVIALLGLAWTRP